MTSERPGNQRRSPSQARSRATWEAIVEAAAQILERDGADAFSTGSVAERAGVSIGTLYQYFPDKQAILAAAAKRELGEDSAAPPARRRALIEALIAMVEGLGRLGAPARPPRPQAPTAARRTRRETGWARRCAEALEQLVTILIGPQPVRRPIRIQAEPRRRR
ncbi:MAG TPA: helix-turn-helix domain-containing protein [Caulobacteraceae bacterium]|nr:helix-turn-helix domain-containing protein [Caulobacteraceae bacterium]